MSRTLICNGGPFHGKPLTLENPSVGSLVFSIGNKTGRYIQRPIENPPLPSIPGCVKREQEYFWEQK